MADKRTWTKEDTFSLIGQFESLPILWDSKSADYKNKIKKQNALKSLADSFETTETEVNRKVHNLRTQFHQELRKIRKNKSGNSIADDNYYECSWEFFKSLRFILADHSEPKIVDNLANDEVKTEAVEYCEVVQTPEEKTRKTKHKCNDDDDVLEKAMKIMKKPGDDFQIFGDFVASELRNLRSREHQNKLKRMIQRAILEISELEDNDKDFSLSAEMSNSSWR